MLPLTQTNPSSHPGAPSSSTTVAAANTDNTINYPTRAPPGAPGRSYLNTHLAPYQRTGMSKILDVKPQYPLRWLGEYLISQSLIHEGGTDEKGVVERFIYDEHAAAVKKWRPDSTPARVENADRDVRDDARGVNGVDAGHAEADSDRGGQGEEAKAAAAAAEQDTEMGEG